MMFFIAEVHPFTDGNGRIARIMMNAELVAEGEHRIIVPTVYRNNYLVALKALTHNRQPQPLLRTLDFAQRYTALVDWSDRRISQRILSATHAFVDPLEADVQGVRLTLPDDTVLAEAREGEAE
jgi:Fic family protein